MFERPFTLVLVEWIDSHGEDHAWVKPDKVEERQPAVCQTVGYVVDETDTALTVAQSIGLGTEGHVEELGGVFTIPQGCVTRRHEIREDFAC